ncbi:MAG TPA: EAL domain-containing protein [Allosphingosinicella sp.]
MTRGSSGKDHGRRPSVIRDLAILLLALSLLALYLSLSRNHVAIGQVLARIGADNGSLVIGLLLLNIALTIYGWRRYRDTARELVERSRTDRSSLSGGAIDPLTGFLDRRGFVQAAAAMVAAASRKNDTVALLVVDLDGFKHVNEVHGHLTGDNLLRCAADVIQHTLPRSTLTARLGADEFAAAFPVGEDGPAEVGRLADCIVERLGSPFNLGGVHTHVSASIGVAQSGPDGRSVEALLRRAGIALSTAKKLGRSRFVWFDATMERELEARNATEEGLRLGIPKGEIIPYFEPQVDLQTQSLHGFEMLARWEHPERGLVGPDEFISVAEEAGLIGDLSLAVMKQAFVEAREWDSRLSLSVNISPVQLKDPWLAQKITKLLVETGFPPERLEIEITESSLFENLGLAQAIVSSLKNQGIRLALDDFGTGYSSLAHLRALPFERIKIDRSFVSSINDNADSVAIVTAITRLAESLKLAVTAEGIEDETVEGRLRQIGRYQGQGWLFGKPMPAADATALVKQRGLLVSPGAAKPSEVRDPESRRLSRTS